MRIVWGPKLSERTTLGLGGTGLAEVLIEEPRDWELLSRVLEKEGGRPYALGQGSNLLVESGQIPVVLVCLAQGQTQPEIFENKDLVTVQVECGLRLSRLMRWLQSYGLSGLEGLVGIPGTLGGAVAMNAGSYGYEIGTRIKRIQFWTPEDGLFWKDRSDVGIEYRYFSPEIENWQKFWQAARVELALVPERSEDIKNRLQDLYLKKKSSQPILSRTCGCVFKNPDKDCSAGYLLEQTGFRGFTMGGMAFSERHANFLINLGQGRSVQAFELIDLACERVKSRFGVELEKEVCVLGATKL